jgi:integrase
MSENRINTKATKGKRPLTENEVRLLLKCAVSLERYDIAAVFAIAYGTGARVLEIVRARYTDFLNPDLTLKERWSYKTVKRVKPRVTPLPQFMLPYILKTMDKDTQMNWPIARNKMGQEMNKQVLYDRLNEVLDLSQIPDASEIGFHSFRKAYANRIVYSGGTDVATAIMMLQADFCHENPQQTIAYAQIQVSFMDDMKSKAFENF